MEENKIILKKPFTKAAFYVIIYIEERKIYMNKINFAELQKRADEVFCLDEGDLVISVDGEKDSTRIRMYNEISGLEWDLLPDMTERPEALAYLKGERGDFND